MYYVKSQSQETRFLPMSRKVEVYSGAYASGKSETSINRSLQFAKKNIPITLVDLDTVEPAYCLRPLIPRLESLNINVVAQKEYFGLGEAASYVNQSQIHCLSNPGNIIIDVGYGASGLDILDIIEGIENEKNLEINLVVNTSKFETMDKKSILEYIKFASGINEKPWEKSSNFISNTHFANETTKEDVIRGYEILKEVSQETQIPIKAIGISQDLSQCFEEDYFDNVEIWRYERMMPDALW